VIKMSTKDMTVMISAETAIALYRPMLFSRS
jgi:hypothetical protein